MVFPSRYVPLRVIDRIFCHLDRSAVEWKDLRPVRIITTLPFVISTGAPKERSGEICGLFLPITAIAGHNDSTLCHLDRSEAQ
jgi:hypothetical protein